jgi:hypothetical protein
LKLTLRDYFWLMLCVASVVVWKIERDRRTEARQPSWFLRTDRGLEPSQAELGRRSALAKLSKLSDEELDEYLGQLLLDSHWNRHSDYEPCLVEMVRRRLVGPLQKHYDALMAGSAGKVGFDFPANLELLTALRQAQGKRDPLRIRMTVGNANGPNSDVQTPRLQATIENVDVDHEPVMLKQGGDDRGGRPERWRSVLIDKEARQVLDSNFHPFNGGGLMTIGPLKHAEKAQWNYYFDLRYYVAPPRSGKYQLQALYHNGVGIAGERDVSGLIVSKSEPIRVEVTNRDASGIQLAPNRAPLPLAITAACIVLTLVSIVGSAVKSGSEVGKTNSIKSNVRRLPGISRRDFWWGVLVLTLSLGMWMDDDGQRMNQMTTSQAADAEADWSIRLSETGK